MLSPLLQDLTLTTTAALTVTAVFAAWARLGWRRGKTIREP